jgi:hypothetical protein
MTLTCPICNQRHCEVCIVCNQKCPTARMVAFASGFRPSDVVYACMNPTCVEFLRPKRIGDKQGHGLCREHKIAGTHLAVKHTN